jgi:hypothetical protein
VTRPKAGVQRRYCLEAVVRSPRGSSLTAMMGRAGASPERATALRQAKRPRRRDQLRGRIRSATEVRQSAQLLRFDCSAVTKAEVVGPLLLFAASGWPSLCGSRWAAGRGGRERKQA